MCPSSATVTSMITGSLKNHVDRIWDTFWAGGIANPITVVEQFTYLLFLKHLDKKQDEIDRWRALGATDNIPADIFPKEAAEKGVPLRWHELVALKDKQRVEAFEEHVFPFLTAQEDYPYKSPFGGFLKRAQFGIDNPSTLASVMGLIDKLTFSNKDMLGDLYEYVLSKLATQGTNGQFRTPTHIIDTMVALVRPRPTDRIIDPAAGTAGFLIGANEWIMSHHKKEIRDSSVFQAYKEHGLTGHDSDATMVRLAAMNLFLHGFENPNITYQDSLQQLESTPTGIFDVVLANPPFSGSINKNSIDQDLTSLFTTSKTELLFVQRFLTLLRLGGRAAVIVPEGVLFGSTKAHKALRKELLDHQQLDAVIKLPSGTFKPYSGVSTAILCFTRSDAQSEENATENVWFYEVRADGYSLDDKRTPLLAPHLLGPHPTDRPQDPEIIGDEPNPVILDEDQVKLNNLQDVVTRFAHRADSEKERARTDQSFTVPAREIRENDYDLSMNRYKEVVLDEVDTRDPLEILQEIKLLDDQITAGLTELEAMLTQSTPTNLKPVNDNE